MTPSQQLAEALKPERMSAAEWRSQAQDEHAVQKSIIEYLDKKLPPFIRVVAVSNKPRSAMQGHLEKARGARKGFPDLIVIREGGICGLMEVKIEGGKLSPEQKEWRDWCAGNSIPYAVVRSVSDVEETLIHWRAIERAK